MTPAQNNHTVRFGALGWLARAIGSAAWWPKISFLVIPRRVVFENRILHGRLINTHCSAAVHDRKPLTRHYAWSFTSPATNYWQTASKPQPPESWGACRLPGR